MIKLKKKEFAQSWINVEYEGAVRKFPKFNSVHEGYAVILEELDELWEAIKKNDEHNITEEAIQVGAMALRFLVDLRVSDEI